MPLLAPRPRRPEGGLPAEPLGSTGPVAAKLLTTFPRARWPFKRGSRPPSAAAAPGLSSATTTTATYPAAGRGPPLRASQWLQPAPPQVLIGRCWSRSAGRGPTPPREERAASRRREGKNMEAAVPLGAEAPRSRHAPRGRGPPRGTPGGVVLPRNRSYPFTQEGPGPARRTGRRRNRDRGPWGAGGAKDGRPAPTCWPHAPALGAGAFGRGQAWGRTAAWGGGWGRLFPPRAATPRPCRLGAMLQGGLRLSSACLHQPRESRAWCWAASSPSLKR